MEYHVHYKWTAEEIGKHWTLPSSGISFDSYEKVFLRGQLLQLENDKFIQIKMKTNTNNKNNIEKYREEH